MTKAVVTRTCRKRGALGDQAELQIVDGEQLNLSEDHLHLMGGGGKDLGTIHAEDDADAMSRGEQGLEGREQHEMTCISLGLVLSLAGCPQPLQVKVREVFSLARY